MIKDNQKALQLIKMKNNGEIKIDHDDPNCPPRFDCQNCDDIMIPVYYKNYKEN